VALGVKAFPFPAWLARLLASSFGIIVREMPCSVFLSSTYWTSNAATICS
jgi:hypothetical protein